VYPFTQNAETWQLWAELEAASGYPVASVMETWTQQMGFPLVRVQSLQHHSPQGERVLLLSQSKFTANGEEDTGSLWRIPISISSSGGPTVRVILDQPHMEVRLPGVSPSDWVKVSVLY
jgi:puromycin-sensitive aminopeptidase